VSADSDGSGASNGRANAAGEPRYPYVELDLSDDDVEDASIFLFDLGALGVEQRDATTKRGGLPEGGDGAADRQVTLIGSFEQLTEARAAARELPAAWNPRVGEVVGDGWRDEWKKHFEPFRLCRGIVVRPPWRTVRPEPGERVIELEPGRAFGTGLHETTSLVAEILAENAGMVRDSALLDVGCGSGILALVALALGASFARAVDIDPEAVCVTRENAERNGFSARLHVDGTPPSALTVCYPTVVANIEAAPLIELASALAARVSKGGRLVLSGILAPDVAPTQWESVWRAYPAFHLDHVRRKGEWMAAVLRA